MKFLFFIISAVVFSNTSLADVACWAKEKNPVTKKNYTTEAEWRDHSDRWWMQNKIIPNPFHLLTAYNVIEQEKAVTSTLKVDKVKHCYVGCKIAQQTDVATAQYVAWYKEIQDLNDCNAATHFEYRDYQATLYGGQLRDHPPVNCKSTCLQVWGQP